jgi:hypothetical protein
MTFSRFTAFLFFFLLSVVIFARDIEIYVEDEDIAMPLEGAVIALRGGRQFVCDEYGKALVSLPDDRQTVVSVAYPGYETLRLTIPAAGNSSGTERFTASLRLGGIMQGQELVVEAARPETSETKSGRSVAISDRELERTSEIGIIEDVMNSVKLLPGVGYTGMFSAMPSIRGGDPGDLMAVLDGFYLERPYHWMGSISIFDPKMVSSARLSHGVFSTRYGHTISGLLEVTSKSPSPTETEMEVAIGSSTASLNLSIPMWGKGGFLFMGKVTYWDTLVWAAKGLSRLIDNENLNMINSVSTAPYIRSAAVSMNYRFTPNLEWRLNGFIGGDGVGANVKTDYSQYTNDDIEGVMEMKADYGNYQGFLITGLTASPVPKLALRFSGGVGFIRTVTDDYINNNITARYNEDFLLMLPDYIADDLRGKSYTAPNVNVKLSLEDTLFSAQGRTDADIDLGKGFIMAFGVQELYSLWKRNTDVNLDFLEIPASFLDDYLDMLPPELWFIKDIENLAIIMQRGFKSNIFNQGFNSSAYTLVEYLSPNKRFGAELGLRLDHFYFKGKNFSFQTMPALNPRLNIDFGIVKNRGIIDSITATAGTGLFSSLNPLISFFDPDQFSIGQSTEFGDVDIKFNRSWTSVIGFKFDFLQKYSFNIEGYYKRVFNRGYITADIISGREIIPQFNFDGIGNVYGFDLQLQKLESRYWDGWISYTFTWAKYLDPSGGGEGISMGSVDTVGGQWYYPSFHRFHNCNIVMNIKPLRWFNIGVRFGFASGQPRDKVSNEIEPYPVLYINEEGEAVIVQKYRRKKLTPEEQGIERTAWSLPLDIKFSFFPVNKSGKANLEIYLAGENILSLVYSPAGRTRFNDYTGKEDPDSGSGNFDMPIPLVSFGFKWRY